MPTTRPRVLRFGGLEVQVALDRMLAERLKASAPVRMLRASRPGLTFRADEPVLNGETIADIDWYHTIDLGGGVVTPGFVDHRDQVGLYGLPDSLVGKRCLDVATYDGFWALEMEKRGAAEVVGIDVFSLNDCDFPTNFRDEYLTARDPAIKGKGFAYAKRALHSRIKRRVLSVYELSPEKLGTFDFIFMGDLLLHLREPLRALEAVWSVCRGDIIVANTYSKQLEEGDVPNSMRMLLGLDNYSGCLWWDMTASVLEVMLQVARFEDVRKINQFDLIATTGVVIPKVVFSARRGRR